MSGAEPWLFVVDMQVCFADATSPWAVPEYADAEAAVRRLLQRFGPRSVLTRFVGLEAPEGAWVDYYREWPTMRLGEADPAWDLTVPVPDGAVGITRPTFSKWDADVAVTIPREAPLVICGVATETCVLATALDAVDDGRKLVLIEDACRGADRGLHDSAVTVLRSYRPQVDVVTMEEFRPR